MEKPKFNIIYADPPWRFNNVNTGGSMHSGSAFHYPTMTMKKLRLLPMWKLAATDCLLALWIPTSLKDEGLEVMRSWGFQYKTTVYWVKKYPGRRMGMGHWTRSGVEELLIGLRGHVRPWRIQRPGWIMSPVLRHSQKPNLFRDLLWEGSRNKFEHPPLAVELFARRRYPNWTAIGHAIDGQEIETVIRTWG